MRIDRCHIRKLFLACVACIFLTLSSLAAFYVGFEYLADRLRHEKGYDSGTANAIKHAYAAAMTYKLFAVVLDAQDSESAVMALGRANEAIERGLKFSNPDSYEEILKDIHNNLAGVSAARFQADCGCGVGMLDVVAGMAERRILVVSRHRNPYYKGVTAAAPRNGLLQEADRWLAQNSAAIRARVYSDLNRFYSAR